MISPTQAPPSSSGRTPRGSGSAADFTIRSEPLSASEFAAALQRIGGFEARPIIAVAVSGGPDSMALVLLADAWARERRGKVWALTVDHGLRAESAEEARQVGDWLAARAISHRILVWRGGKPATGVQAAARDARYRLLADWCRDQGCLHLMTAHHREDQAETYLIRQRAGSGADGLSGMAAVRELHGCRLVRPLLTVPRARLAALLEAQGQSWLHDPSNLNPVFERARLRLGPDLRDGASIDAVFAAAHAFGCSRTERDRMLHRALAQTAALHPAGFGMLDRAALGSFDPELRERVLARVAAVVGGARYPIRRERLVRLRARLDSDPERARTLGGCRFTPWRGRLLVVRELAGVEPPLRLAAGERRVWDRRFLADLPPAADGSLMFGHLNSFGPAGPELRPLLEKAGLPPLVHSALPAFWDECGVAAVPVVGYRRVGTTVLPSLVFAPANPLATAGFTVV